MIEALVGRPVCVPDTDVWVTYQGPVLPTVVERVSPGCGRIPQEWFLRPGTILVVIAARVGSGAVAPCEVTVGVEPQGPVGVVTAQVRDLAVVRECVFCRIVTGIAPAVVVGEWSDALAFTPLDPVVEGHTLVVPTSHVADALTDPVGTGVVMRRAADFATRYGAVNLQTSVGRAATQSVFHLHVHVIPRSVGDGLMVPWGIVGDPREPHRCQGMDELEAEVERLRGVCRPLGPPWPFSDGRTNGPMGG